MNDYATCAETASAVRLALKAKYPTQQFSVRSSNYSGGSSVHVSWIDGPGQREVDAYLDPFAGCDFDSSQDLKTYRRTLITLPNGRRVTPMSWVSCSRRTSAEAAESARFRAEWDARKAARKARHQAEQQKLADEGATLVQIGRTQYQARRMNHGYALYGPRGASVYALRYLDRPELLYATIAGRSVRLTDADGTLRVREV